MSPLRPPCPPSPVPIVRDESNTASSLDRLQLTQYRSVEVLDKKPIRSVDGWTTASLTLHGVLRRKNSAVQVKKEIRIVLLKTMVKTNEQVEGDRTRPRRRDKFKRIACRVLCCRTPFCQVEGCVGHRTRQRQRLTLLHRLADSKFISQYGLSQPIPLSMLLYR